jgi:hypothetical protein
MKKRSDYHCLYQFGFEATTRKRVPRAAARNTHWRGYPETISMKAIGIGREETCHL